MMTTPPLEILAVVVSATPFIIGVVALLCILAFIGWVESRSSPSNPHVGEWR